MTFVIAFFSFILVMVGTIWLIVRLFRLKPQPAAGATAANPPAGNQQPPTGKPATRPPSGLSKFVGKKWLKPLAIIGAVALLYFFWNDINTALATRIAESAAGKAVGVEKESVQSWLWVPGVLFAGWLLMRLFKSKSTTSPAWGKRSMSEWFTAINDGLVLWAFILIPTVVVLDVVGFFDDVSKLPVKMSRAAACTTQDEAWNIAIDTAGRKMVVCSEEKPLFVFPEKGGSTLVFDFSEEFKEKNKDLLQGRTLQDFVLISAPNEYRGHAADAWRIMPLKSRPELKYVSAWDRSGVKDISIVVRAVD